ncbi:hypothetical protein ACFQ6S_37205 [Streptomyces sp. NPDC056479]|uniref:hypothetical protein n=1 Tax=Streptomyces sp. NPDC056479 TaxID=3345832 RepID=UPI003691E989
MIAIKFLISLCALPIALVVAALISFSCLLGAAAGLIIGAPVLALGVALGDKDKGAANGLADWIAKCFRAAVDIPSHVFDNVYGSIWDEDVPSGTDRSPW